MTKICGVLVTAYLSNIFQGLVMLLAVDVGNSHTVSGVFSGDKLVAEWRLKSDRDRTGDELAIRYHSLFQMAEIPPGSITGFIVSSVVPTLETVWMTYADRYLAGQLLAAPVSVSSDTETGVKIVTETPSEVGADRIVNSVAACRQFSPPLIVIDFGTAITFDCVNARKEYLGGTILPGIGISLDALSSRTAKLPRVDIEKAPQYAIGRNSVEAIRSGILIGFGGMIDRMVDRLVSELGVQGQQVSIIATGGMAHLIAPYSNHLHIIDPLLTLKGLKIIFDLQANREAAAS
ncbi:MAG: type III pantothenate kinase [Desulfobulbaceae bacterium]|nr:type III pantothenate kinase [Desulfobulbaceae bacterium]